MNFGKHDRMIKYLFFLILILSSPLHSHEIKPAVMDITIIEGNASIEFKLNAETVLSEIDASLYQDTNDSPQSQKYDALRALSTEEVEKMVIENENKFTDKIKINIGDETIPLSLRNVDTFQEINDEFPRETALSIGFEIKDESFTIQFEKELKVVSDLLIEASTYADNAGLKKYLELIINHQEIICRHQDFLIIHFHLNPNYYKLLLMY